MRLPLRPDIQIGSVPRRPWSSTTRNGQCLPMMERSNSISEAPPMLGMKLACGRIAFTTSSQSATSLVRTTRRQAIQACQTGSSTLVVARQVVARGGPEVRLAARAIADAVPLPAVGEDRVDVVVAGDLGHHLRHELAVVVAIGAGHPDVGEGPVPARVAVLVDGDPFRDARRPRPGGWHADRRAP